MRINLLYNFKKILNKFEILILWHKKIEVNLFLLNKKDIQIKSILLYFPDYEMMHYGDHLFFEPLARILRLKGYQLYITPINTMEFYFKNLGYKIAKKETINKVDLIITKVEFLKDFKKNKNQVMLIDTANPKIQLPLCNDIIEKVCRFLKNDFNIYDSIPSYFYDENSTLSCLNKNDNYIIFNNYIDSGSIRSGAKHQNLIINFIIKLKNDTGCKIIHTGSSNDKNMDQRDYDFVDIDMRGTTSIKQLFNLCSLDNVLYNVSFDGFQMHLFLIQKKKSFILFRGRFLKKNEDFIKKYVNPPFFLKNAQNIIEYID